MTHIFNVVPSGSDMVLTWFRTALTMTWFWWFSPRRGEPHPEPCRLGVKNHSRSSRTFTSLQQRPMTPCHTTQDPEVP